MPARCPVFLTYFLNLIFKIILCDNSHVLILLLIMINNIKHWYYLLIMHILSDVFITTVYQIGCISENQIIGTLRKVPKVM